MTSSQRTIRVLIPVAGLALTTVLFAACTPNDDPVATATNPATSSSTTKATPTIDPQAQPAVTAYVSFQTIVNRLVQHPPTFGTIPAGADDYTKFTFDPARQSVDALLANLAQTGRRFVGTPPPIRPKVQSVDLSAKPYPKVILTECSAAPGVYQVRNAKGQPDPVPTDVPKPPYLRTMTVIQTSGHWGVSDIKVGDGTCSP